MNHRLARTLGLGGGGGGVILSQPRAFDLYGLSALAPTFDSWGLWAGAI